MRKHPLFLLVPFSAAAVPSGYRLQGVQGFVEELVVNDDPEYQLIDKIRTSRASNEARQRVFSKLSGWLCAVCDDVYVLVLAVCSV